MAIRLAHRFDLIDIPTSRRRHPKPMPIVGGVVVFITLVAGLAFFSLLEPWWFQAHGKSLAAVGTAMSLLVVLGLRDDLHGVYTKGKLLLAVRRGGFGFSLRTPHPCPLLVLV